MQAETQNRENRINIGLPVTVIMVIAAFCCVISCIGRVSSSQDVKASNIAEIQSLDAEEEKIIAELNYYEYKCRQPKNEFVEEEARRIGYVYEDETRYVNSTPGAYR